MMSAALQALSSSVLNYVLQTVKLSCVADRKEALIVAFLLQGGPPQLVFLWPVLITGAMSISVL